jgi:hypothetical protein
MPMGCVLSSHVEHYLDEKSGDVGADAKQCHDPYSREHKIMFTETVHITVLTKSGRRCRKTVQIVSDGCWNVVQAECQKIVDREFFGIPVEKMWWSY